jgi:hypothetical protein
MNPDKMTPDQLAEFCSNQNRTFKVYLSGSDLECFMAEFNAMQETLADDMLAATELSEARAVLARIMAK